MVSPQPLAEAQEWLAGTIETELLRFSTAGSVDDGKSTLIGGYSMTPKEFMRTS